MWPPASIRCIFLTEKNLPKELTNVKVKSTATYNGHPVYIITGTTNATPVVIKTGNTMTTIPTSYWTWWIDRTSSLLYKIETMTPNIVKPVSFGTGSQPRRQEYQRHAAFAPHRFRTQTRCQSEARGVRLRAA